MFVDEVEIEVLAGNGGNGSATFRTEKFVPNGGPNGGDGGHGGSVIFEVNSNVTTLVDFRFRHKYKADRGGDGAAKDCFGKNGGNLVLKVPLGTLVTDIDADMVIADLNTPDARVVIAKGGIGGRGNAHFANSVHQAPHFAELGEPGEVRRLKMELRLLADVGLLGFPNVGKSTLISAVSAARPKIADYPFTTLTPNLGVVRIEAGRSFVMADIPGIIEGAHDGVGLGHQFLRHVSRSRMLIHLLDVSGMSGRDPWQDYKILNRELALYDERLAALPQIVALNKIDSMQDPASVAALQRKLERRGVTVFRISAATRQNLPALIYHVMDQLEAIHAVEEASTEVLPRADAVYRATLEVDQNHWEARMVDETHYEVIGKGLERMVAMTNLDNDVALRRLQKSLDKIGVTKSLKNLGAKDGDTVRIRDIEFEYQDEDKTDEDFEAQASGRNRRSTRSQ